MMACQDENIAKRSSIQRSIMPAPLMVRMRSLAASVTSILREHTSKTVPPFWLEAIRLERPDSLGVAFRQRNGIFDFASRDDVLLPTCIGCSKHYAAAATRQIAR